MDTRTIRVSRRRAHILSWSLCGFLAVAPVSALADSLEMSKEAGFGVGSAVATLVYAPLKLCYAIGGLVIGGLAWGFSGGDNNVAKVVLTPSVLGDYVVTPAHLRGDQSIEFFGRDPKYRQARGDVAASPSREQAW
jgi:hypothetical protein